MKVIAQCYHSKETSSAVLSPGTIIQVFFIIALVIKKDKICDFSLRFRVFVTQAKSGIRPQDKIKHELTLSGLKQVTENHLL